MHARIGYREEGWNQRSMFELQIALDEIEKFQEIFFIITLYQYDGNNKI